MGYELTAEEIVRIATVLARRLPLQLHHLSLADEGVIWDVDITLQHHLSTEFAVTFKPHAIMTPANKLAQRVGETLSSFHQPRVISVPSPTGGYPRATNFKCNTRNGPHLIHPHPVQWYCSSGHFHAASASR